MNIRLLAAGTKPPGWVSEGFNEYQKRLPREYQLILKEIKIAKRSRGEPVANCKAEEGDRMLSAMDKDARVVAVDRQGSMWSTRDLAQNLENWATRHRTINLLVGGPDGLAEQCLSVSHDCWSLSGLTFPHFLVRVIIAEQLYRACSILSNHPYHR
ncbi:MAG: 23S rRNA (pseudouridine(1915)-N(3))-methyltransferase RlmH [Pseudomonadales bacterium]